MNEILFRGRRKDDSEWVYGYYCFIGHADEKKHCIIPEYASAFYGIEVVPETVGQSIGKKDIHGRKIFCGDTFSGTYDGLYLKWCDKCSGFGLHSVYDPGYCMACNGYITLYELLLDTEKGDTWVSGTIHDNLEPGGKL